MDIINSGTCGGNFVWTLDDAGTLTISGTGDMADYVSGTTPWDANRKEITSVVVKSGVTAIGKWAFAYCRSLKSVTIPDSVTTIGEWAFGYCESLASVTIPDSVTTIGNSAFYDCESLASVTIPDSVTVIGKWAFAFCYSLSSVYYGGTAGQWAAIKILGGNYALKRAHIKQYRGRAQMYDTRVTFTEEEFSELSAKVSAALSLLEIVADFTGNAQDPQLNNALFGVICLMKDIENGMDTLPIYRRRDGDNV